MSVCCLRNCNLPLPRKVSVHIHSKRITCDRPNLTWYNGHNYYTLRATTFLLEGNTRHRWKSDSFVRETLFVRGNSTTVNVYRIPAADFRVEINTILSLSDRFKVPLISYRLFFPCQCANGQCPVLHLKSLENPSHSRGT